MELCVLFVLLKHTPLVLVNVNLVLMEPSPMSREPHLVSLALVVSSQLLLIPVSTCIVLLVLQALSLLMRVCVRPVHLAPSLKKELVVVPLVLLVLKRIM